MTLYNREENMENNVRTIEHPPCSAGATVVIAAKGMVASFESTCAVPSPHPTGYSAPFSSAQEPEWTRIAQSEDLEILFDQWREMLRSQQRGGLEVRVREADAGNLTFEVRSTPVLDNQARPIAMGRMLWRSST
ncbi:MAG: hypothetical protein WDO73_25000 [Ignavibacteriota bacterium]